MINYREMIGQNQRFANTPSALYAITTGKLLADAAAEWNFFSDSETMRNEFLSTFFSQATARAGEHVY
jgi:hypothetical protein